VLFDLWGTLIPFPHAVWDEVLAQSASALDANPEEFLTAWHADYANRAVGDLESSLRRVCQQEIVGVAMPGLVPVMDGVAMRAVLDAAVDARAPVIIQTSVKTVVWEGAPILACAFREMAAGLPVPVSLHLDHCPDRKMISQCIGQGWNSVLFDGSALIVEENTAQTAAVIAEAHAAGVDVEGELEAIRRVEEGPGEADEPYSVDVALAFIKATGVDCFAPAIGNAHGLYRSEPSLDSERVTQIVEKAAIPIALHGGTGMSQAQFDDLISRSCAKVNISTALKIADVGAHMDYLRRHPEIYDPPDLFRFVHRAVQDMAFDHIRRLGSQGRA
jgi:fructose-bisphosphate aldolase class II